MEKEEMNIYKRIAITGVILAACVVFIAITTEYRKKNTDYDGILIENIEETVSSIRRGYKHRAQTITLKFQAYADISDRIEEVTAELIEKAMKETSDPYEGDYIRYHTGGYRLDYTVDKKRKNVYTLQIIPTYYTSLEQEEYVVDKSDKIINEIIDEDMSDADKIEAIYEYIYNNVSYDTVHKYKDNNKMKNTAYSALYYNCSGCQGYSVLLYMLSQKAGIRARVVTGMYSNEGLEERHAWNIVQIEDKWYNIDVTTDSVKGSRDSFLRGSVGFDNHIMDEEFRDYTISRGDYEKTSR